MAAYVYMMSNKRYGTVYVGVTNDIVRRAWEHREGMLPGFTSKHGLHDLVWYEQHESIVEAIQREHTMKHWPRKWKTALVDAMNPGAAAFALNMARIDASGPPHTAAPATSVPQVPKAP